MFALFLSLFPLWDLATGFTPFDGRFGGLVEISFQFFALVLRVDVGEIAVRVRRDVVDGPGGYTGGVAVVFAFWFVVA